MAEEFKQEIVSNEEQQIQKDQIEQNTGSTQEKLPCKVYTKILEWQNHIKNDGSLAQLISASKNYATLIKSNHNFRNCSDMKCICKLYFNFSMEILLDSEFSKDIQNTSGQFSYNELSRKLKESQINYNNKNYFLQEIFSKEVFAPEVRETATEFMKFKTIEIFGDPELHFEVTVSMLEFLEKKLIKEFQQKIQILLMLHKQNLYCEGQCKLKNETLNIVKDFKIFLAEMSAQLLDIGKVMLCLIFDIQSKKLESNEQKTVQKENGDLQCDIKDCIKNQFMKFTNFIFSEFETIQNLGLDQKSQVPVDFTKKDDSKVKAIMFHLPKSWREIYLKN